MPDKAGVSLREITEEALPGILALEVGPDQLEHYPRSNAYSLAQAHVPPDAVDPDYEGVADRLVEKPELIETLDFLPDAWFRGIYAGETPVGFVMLSLDVEKASTSSGGS